MFGIPPSIRGEHLPMCHIDGTVMTTREQGEYYEDLSRGKYRTHFEPGSAHPDLPQYFHVEEGNSDLLCPYDEAESALRASDEPTDHGVWFLVDWSKRALCAYCVITYGQYVAPIDISGLHITDIPQLAVRTYNRINNRPVDAPLPTHTITL